MKTLLLLTFILIPGSLLMAQTFSGDSILANERSIDRPITLHARQARITGGYGLSIISRRYNTEGEVVKLRDEGLSSIRHRFTLDLKYGINDFIQLNASIASSSNVVREQTRYIFPIEPEPVVMHDVTKEYSGLEDLYVGVDLRAPINTRKVDISLTLGATLPVASYEPKEPEHSFEVQQEAGMNTNAFTYRYYYPLGRGIVIAQLGGMVKYRLPKWAFSARVDYQHGLKDGKSYEWIHQLDNNSEFEYRQDPFTYRLPDSFSYFAEAEYQPLPWFDIFLNVSGFNASRGWTSPQEDLKVALPDQSGIFLNPGFEIIITPRLWFRERITFALSGKSHEAPFGFQTTLLYNFFPF
ncbi:MAG: hypothetical protein WEB30_13380 [Cyclobacteriaceae bacterium]